MPMKKKDWGLHKVNSQLIMDFGFERIMMNHIASEMISIIAQEQKMFETQHPLQGGRLSTECVGDCIRQLQHIINRKIERGIQIETVQKKRGSQSYFLKISGDPYLETHLTPWPLDTPEEYLEPEYSWLMDNATGKGNYVWPEEKKAE